MKIEQKLAEVLLTTRQQQKDAEKKIHISFSEFSKYKTCGHFHLIMKYLGLDKEPPSIHLYFGSAIHSAIEELIKKDGDNVEYCVKFFTSMFEKDMKENMKDAEEYGQVDDFVAQGENLLRILNLKELLKDYEVYSVEEQLYEKIYGIFYFKGYIDLVLKHKKTGKFLVIDWKTASEPWRLEYKLTDDVFLCQMRFYKYFWARKNNIPLSDISCKYTVLSRLKNKKRPGAGFGSIDDVNVDSTEEEIKTSLRWLSEVVRNIHILNSFKKVKIFGNERKGCMFCKYKNGAHVFCDLQPDQDKYFLREHNDKIKLKI